jgi:hypothetical protein
MYTMITEGSGKDSLKLSPQANEDFNFKGLFAADAAAGDLPNEKVKHCYVCADRGYPHEPIEIHKINGRLRHDGTHDTQGHEIRDYYTGMLHQHKQRKQQRQDQDQQKSQKPYYLGWNLEAMLK